MRSVARRFSTSPWESIFAEVNELLVDEGQPMGDATDDGLVKILVKLTDEPFGSESFWAKPLGGDMYELRNSPWYAFDLHFKDVVRAIPDNAAEKPRIREVVSRSGHRTLRVIFPAEIAMETRLELLTSLNKWQAFYEGANASLYAVDVEPHGDYAAVCDQLWEWEQQGLLSY